MYSDTSGKGFDRSVEFNMGHNDSITSTSNPNVEKGTRFVHRASFQTLKGFLGSLTTLQSTNCSEDDYSGC